MRLIVGDKAEFVLLLGSAGTPRFQKESDIDLAAYFITPPSFEEMTQITNSLESKLNRDCDLVALNSVDLIYARQVLDTGRELLVKNRPHFNIWKAKILSEYPDFKRSRKIVEENLLNRKKHV